MSDNKQKQKSQVNDKFSELRNKFIKKKDSEYPLQQQSYIKEDIDRKINEFEKILETEVELSNRLDDNAEIKIQDAKTFFDTNNQQINEQFNKLNKLEEDICFIMEQNKQKQELEKIIKNW